MKDHSNDNSQLTLFDEKEINKENVKNEKTESPIEQEVSEEDFEEEWDDDYEEDEEYECDMDTYIAKCMSPEKLKQAKEDVLLGKEDTKVVLDIKGLFYGIMKAFIPDWEKKKGITFKKALKYINSNISAVDEDTLSELLILLFTEFRNKEKFYFQQDVVEEQERENFSRYQNVLNGLFEVSDDTGYFVGLLTTLNDAQEGRESSAVEMVREMMLARICLVIEDEFLEEGLFLREYVLGLATIPFMDRGILRTILSILFPPLEEGMIMSIVITYDDEENNGEIIDVDVNFRKPTTEEKEEEAYYAKLQEYTFGAIERFIPERALSRGVTKKRLVKPIKDLLKYVEERKKISTGEALDFIEHYFPEFEDGRKLYITFKGPEIGTRRLMSVDFR